MNDLSNTIDLQSTLARAEALFRRFQRTVEAVDRKQQFPAPSIRQRKPAAEGKADAAAGAGLSSATETGRLGSGTTDEEGQLDKVISPELRHLLRREVAVMDKKEVREHGGGVH